MHVPPRRAQVVVSLLVSAIMLGKNATSLIAIIRTINRQQEIEMLIGELAQSPSNIPMELMECAHAQLCMGPLRSSWYGLSPHSGGPTSDFVLLLVAANSCAGYSPATDELNVSVRS
jgi:hypothetical protein